MAHLVFPNEVSLKQRVDNKRVDGSFSAPTVGKGLGK